MSRGGLEHSKFLFSEDSRLDEIGAGDEYTSLTHTKETGFSFIQFQSGLNLSFLISMIAYFSRKSSLAMFI